MKQKLVFASNNKNKLKEIRAIIGDSCTILSLEDIGCTTEIVEDGDTLEANALIKAQFVKDNYGYDCFADDTGLEVEVLNNAPGVYSARYASSEHDDKANMEKLLAALATEKNRLARFRTSIALIKEGKQYFFDGIIDGEIAREARGNNGFGYDPVFIPNGYQETFAELDINIKNQISHRAKAVNALAKFLQTI